jgi:hypothetical protein
MRAASPKNVRAGSRIDVLLSVSLISFLFQIDHPNGRQIEFLAGTSSNTSWLVKGVTRAALIQIEPIAPSIR